jgi:hypothetical protein
MSMLMRKMMSMMLKSVKRFSDHIMRKDEEYA